RGGGDGYEGGRSNSHGSGNNQAAHRFDHDGDAGRAQEEHLDEARDVLRLAVAPGVVLVGGLGGGPDAGIGEDARRQIEKRVGGVGEDRDTAGQQADQQLGGDQDDID